MSSSVHNSPGTYEYATCNVVRRRKTLIGNICKTFVRITFQVIPARKMKKEYEPSTENKTMSTNLRSTVRLDIVLINQLITKLYLQI